MVSRLKLSQELQDGLSAGQTIFIGDGVTGFEQLQAGRQDCTGGMTVAGDEDARGERFAEQLGSCQGHRNSSFSSGNQEYSPGRIEIPGG